MKKFIIFIVIIFLFSSCAEEDHSTGPESLVNGMIVLVTDYGEDDFYVGQLKGQIYSVFPDAEVIDGTHNIPSFNIRNGAYILKQIAVEFLSGTVFCAIIVPDAAERAITIVTQDDKIFVAPDNGLLTYAINELGIKNAYEITNYEIMGIDTTSTYEIKEIYGPVSAYLASGFPLENVGPEIYDYEIFPVNSPHVQDSTIFGEIVYIDIFGNLFSNITEEFIDSINVSLYDTLEITFADSTINALYGTTYSDVPVGDYISFINLEEILQIAINIGNLSETLGVNEGDTLRINKKF